MGVRQSNKTKQPLLTRLGLLAGSAVFFVLAILMVEVYPGDQNYDWKAHVRVEESRVRVEEGSIEAKIKDLKDLKKELRLEKYPQNSELFRQIDRSLSLHESLKDYNRKLSLEVALDAEKQAFYKEKIEAIEHDLLNLSSQNYE